MPSISGRAESRPPARLVGYDRIVETLIAFPGAIPATRSEGGAVDIHIRRLPTQRASPAPLYRFEQGVLTFCAANVATYLCRSDAIDIIPRRGADPHDVTALLIATALPAVLWCRGDFVLHAAGVRLPGHDRALAIAGSSGIGKSTAAAELLARGASLIADDTICVRAAPEGAIASGLAGGYHLVAPSGEHRVFHPVPPSHSARRSPLGAVAILNRTEGPPGLTRLGVLDAIEQLLDNQHRPRIPAVIGRRADALRFCAYLARTVPVYIWRRQSAAGALAAEELEMLTGCVRG